MSLTIVPQDPVVKAVITALSGNGFSVGDGEAPESPSPAFPYSVVYSLDDARLDGPMNDWQADVWHNIQVTTVGETREQATGLNDLNRGYILAGITVTGRHVAKVERIEGSGSERDEIEQPRYFYSVDIWEILTTPA